ncbi:MAG: glutaredoxin [Betaproteobacteria bacterium]|nr:glutaredoxin [Betaproteobacteria bacterium]MDH4323047.1 glutaredoxin [Betaproteobacteria bacterium]MDH5577497.1 glutaredoxin [Betaproteobacteria bacterium]
MPRPLFDQARVHPAIRDKIAGWGVEIIEEVQQVIEAKRIVVVGMKMNPAPKKARRLLDAAGLEYTYLEYGSYLSGWRRRLPLKLWTGWQTFPMVFVNGVLVGGASDLEKLMASGKLDEMLKQDSE